jgi:hypothetical protein
MLGQGGDKFFRENHFDHFGIFQDAKIANPVVLHEGPALSRRISTNETDFDADLEEPKRGKRVVEAMIISSRYNPGGSMLSSCAAAVTGQADSAAIATRQAARVKLTSPGDI